MKVRFYAILALLLGAFSSNAQDIHFSQFYSSPLTLNPALTGNFNGFYRVSGIYRNQWPGLTTGKPAFSTPSVSVDFSLLREKIKNGALGVGIVFFNDQQNGKTFNQNQILASVAYNMGFGPKAKFQLGLGFQGGLAMYKMNPADLRFHDGYYSDASSQTGFGYDPGLANESFNAG
ncbi:MAG: PorP/SprF family type IX secretion system membrane protein, partial [Bacteroidota bacterium]